MSPQWRLPPLRHCHLWHIEVNHETHQTAAGGRAKVDDSFLWICTYDPQRKEYRSWVFWSAAGAAENPAGNWGSATMASGTWDEAARTLTTRSEDKGWDHLDQHHAMDR